MKIEIKVPAAGESVTMGTISAWRKQNGERVAEGEILFDLETDKAVLEVPSPGAGTLEITAGDGSEVAIGQTVGFLNNGEKSPKETAVEKKATRAKTVEATPTAPPPPLAPSAKETQFGDWHPETQPGIPTPSAPAVKAADTAVSHPPAETRPTERVRMSLIRRKTAARLVKAVQTAAYLTTFNEIDMQKVIDIRNNYKEEFEKEHGIKIGFTSFFVKACCQALKEFPAVNAMADGDDLVYQHFYDIGVAVAMDEGLIVPVIRDADQLAFSAIESKIDDLAKRARAMKILPDELAGGTFTITNGGVFGSLLSTPIPAFPQTAILGLHIIKKRPVVVEEQIATRPMMYAALSYDHRVIDGREAVRFLGWIKDLIEEPDKLLLEL
jgi:2-oxoglutarate dehydrogenase E2 component (dihydrolipoamide succinyltransferase)